MRANSGVERAAFCKEGRRPPQRGLARHELRLILSCMRSATLDFGDSILLLVQPWMTLLLSLDCAFRSTSPSLGRRILHRFLRLGFPSLVLHP